MCCQQIVENTVGVECQPDWVIKHPITHLIVYTTKCSLFICKHSLYLSKDFFERFLDVKRKFSVIHIHDFSFVV